MMAEGKIRDEALADKALLGQVVKHKSRLKPLEQDYKKMGVMIFGKQPPFGSVLDRLAALERDINS